MGIGSQLHASTPNLANKKRQAFEAPVGDAAKRHKLYAQPRYLRVSSKAT